MSKIPARQSSIQNYFRKLDILAVSKVPVVERFHCITKSSFVLLKYLLRILAVAVVGFKNDMQIMLQEGGKSARVCVGFDSSMENVSMEDSVYITIDVIPDINNPGSGYGNTIIIEFNKYLLSFVFRFS